MNEIIITDVKKYKKDNLFYAYWKYEGKEFMQTNTFEMSNDYLKNIIIENYNLYSFEFDLFNFANEYNEICKLNNENADMVYFLNGFMNKKLNEEQRQNYHDCIIRGDFNKDIPKIKQLFN